VTLDGADGRSALTIVCILGGSRYAIYTVESPGGYQIFGRILPIYDLQRRNRVFRVNGVISAAADYRTLFPYREPWTLPLPQRPHLLSR
jgi:hypothetical protein